MFWVVLAVVSGLFILRFYQNLSADPKEEENSQQIGGEFLNSMEGMAHSARELSIRTKIKHEYCNWFRLFANGVTSALELAEEEVKIEKRFKADPKFKKLYLEARAKTNSADEGGESHEQSWIHEGPPQKPDSEMFGEDFRIIVQDEYRKCVDQHKVFVAATRSKLDNSIVLKEAFFRNARKIGIRSLCLEYFEY